MKLIRNQVYRHSSYGLVTFIKYEDYTCNTCVDQGIFDCENNTAVARVKIHEGNIIEQVNIDELSEFHLGIFMRKYLK